MPTPTQVRPILIVDDEPDICEAIELALQLEGFAVRAAQHRDEALQLVQDIKPAIVFLDYRMPGIDCPHFIAELRLQAADAPLVLMTGDQDSAQTALRLGLKYSLSKPFELDQMLDLIRRIDAD